MSDATFILLAGGNQRRWNNYTGVPKHLAVVGGEPVIVRTCRQIKDRQPAEGEQLHWGA